MDEVRQALGSLGIMGEQSVKQHTPKLYDFSTVTDAEAVALTYAFYDAIRWTRLFQVLERFAPHASPELARAVQASHTAISAPETWRARAEAAHKILLDLETEVGPRAIRVRDWVAAKP